MRTWHSIYWKLLALVGGFCLTMIWATNHVGSHIDHQTSYLSQEAQATLAGWGDEARRAVEQGPDAVRRWKDEMSRRESSWLIVVDHHLRPLDGHQLTLEQLRQLTFVHNYEWPMSRHGQEFPLVAVPLGNDGSQLVMRLPERFLPWRHHRILTLASQYLAPALLSGLFCWLLYLMLISPLDQLRRKASLLRGNTFDGLLPAAIAQRKDELGDLGRSLAALTSRLHGLLTQQRQMLRNLSHELRTPLSRLRVATESDLPPDELRQRVSREIESMQTLVDDTLELAWLDGESPQLERGPVDIATLWDVITQDARFESGWPHERLRSHLPADCCVLGNLNALARAFENVLRNAIRHSPPNGEILLSAVRDGDDWLLEIADQGDGVSALRLEEIFLPFTRLSTARPGGDGFGLGLSIARHCVRLQHGELWAESGNPGLRVKFRLKAAS